MLMIRYSISEENTKTVQDDINMSIAFIYETGGSDFWDCACCYLGKIRVTKSKLENLGVLNILQPSLALTNAILTVLRVSREVTQSVTRAGTASGLIQKEIQDIMTIRQVGM